MKSEKIFASKKSRDIRLSQSRCYCQLVYLEKVIEKYNILDSDFTLSLLSPTYIQGFSSRYSI